ncbi:MAG: tripartite tricarboxylate transporter substrate-binding protein [Reyranella sp.]|uniref:tripartite tricarboxylate transporter substrate-binding protein n=1 Tax=Reyranella sp. TaxID=1929291 RepID=UPI002731B4DF|nr:tripartite tricarboxylate transporter substrate-binding protein [Reyranella sp.]MDP1963044.1 tripartite tricarboxylate transporter substrate-binding protein [Reyranella sp.]MDP2374146.1 tripartite tricarboxylate transporter substrate-binding protein [Reyranella sp.]
MACRHIASASLGLDPREWVAWYAFMTPKGTPDDIIQRLNAAINQALGEEAIATRIRDLGASGKCRAMCVFSQIEYQEID